MKHLVFYDGACGLCDHVVQFLLKADRTDLFAFAPLQGETARQMLKDIPKEDSLVLIEDYQTPNPKVYMLGKGALRILWLLGGFWSIPGILSFLPGALYNGVYRLVARNRHRFFKKGTCSLPDREQAHRFLK